MRIAVVLMGLALAGCFPTKGNFCGANGECDSRLCLDYSDGRHSAGSCVPTGEIVYVDRNRTGCADPLSGAGTQQQPFCDLQRAVTASVQSGGVRPYVLVAASSEAYGIVKVSGGEATIVGPWADPALNGADWTTSRLRARVVRGSGAEPGLEVSAMGTQVTVDGLELDGLADQTNGNGAVIRCGVDTTLHLRRIVITGSKNRGIHSESCKEVFIDRSRVANSAGVGILLNKHDGVLPDPSVRITNSLVIGTTDKGVVLSASVKMASLFLFNTILNNTISGSGAEPLGVECDVQGRAEPFPLVDSIIINNRIGMNGSQISDACQPDHVILGQPDSKALDLETRTTPQLEPGTFRLIAGLEENKRCCVGKAKDVVDAGAAESLARDFFGSPRPRQERDIGYHELP